MWTCSHPPSTITIHLMELEISIMFTGFVMPMTPDASWLIIAISPTSFSSQGITDHCAGIKASNIDFFLEKFYGGPLIGIIRYVKMATNLCFCSLNSESCFFPFCTMHMLLFWCMFITTSPALSLDLSCPSAFCIFLIQNSLCLLHAQKQINKQNLYFHFNNKKVNSKHQELNKKGNKQWIQYNNQISFYIFLRILFFSFLTTNAHQ